MRMDLPSRPWISRRGWVGQKECSTSVPDLTLNILADMVRSTGHQVSCACAVAPSIRVLQVERKLLLRTRKGFQNVASTNNTNKLFQRAHRWVSHETVEPSIALDTGGAQDLYPAPSWRCPLQTHMLHIHARPTVAQQLPPAIPNSNVLHCAHQPHQSSTVVTLTTCGCSLPIKTMSVVLLHFLRQPAWSLPPIHVQSHDAFSGCLFDEALNKL